ncbi:MAG TPA: pantoate--beta-alanine ligase [Chitinophagaceae bacterium]|nr:pantoate--beta-alanine ligase [Chitinophagaceae bacterium]
MILVKRAGDLQKEIAKQKQQGNRIGFVPTMGALHEGHISLIAQSRKESGFTACSIFINPTQFNDPEDFEKYPVTIEKDTYALERSGCDLLFLPSVNEIYPGGLSTDKTYDLGYLETILEGKYRPGHFQGVCRVVDRLLQICQPHHLYIGQKDYQQCKVIEKLVTLLHLDLSVRICPTLREKDGLAMSSRNMRLGKEERQKAVTIFKTLNYVKEMLPKNDLQEIMNKAGNMLEKEGFRVDYVAIADATTLIPADHWDKKQKLVVLIAAFLGEVRLIDNMPLN